MTVHRRRPQGGFTLIELLVVIVILGLLAAIVVFATRGTGDRGREAAVQTDERTIRTALEVFCARNDRYPGGPGEPTPPQFRDKPMDELVAGKYLSNPSEYHTVATGDGDVNPRFGPAALADLDPEGKCTRTPKNFKLTCTNTPCGPGPGPVDPPPPQAFSAVATGFGHSLRLTGEGKVFASGSNGFGTSGGTGELGDGTTINRERPVQVKGGNSGSEFLERVKAVEAGHNLSLALRDDGTVWAWGSNGAGRLGDGTLTNRTTPVRSGGDSFGGVTAVSAGPAGAHVLALRNLNLPDGSVRAGEVWAWGDNNNGELGNGSSGGGAFQRSPVQVIGENNSGFLNGVTTIDAGTSHSLAVKNGAVLAWGRNEFGQLGTGDTTARLTPVPVQNLGGSVTAIAAGRDHSLALKNDGTVWLWGRNPGGGSTTTPVEVSGLPAGITAISSGSDHVLAFKDGAVWAWGWGLLGDGSITPDTTPRATPVRVKGYRGGGDLDRATALSAGSTFSMAITDGRVLVWGANNFGQFGTGDWERSLVPTDENDPRPPDNDLMKDRTVLPGTGSSVSVSYTNMFAGPPETDERSHQPESYGPSAGKSVWFEWTNGSLSVGTVTFFTAEGDLKSNFKTTIAAYTRPGYAPNDPLNTDPSVSNLTLVEDLDRNDSPGEETRVTVPATQGVVYFIAVDGSNPVVDNEGGIKLSWTIRTPDQRRPCGGYDC